MLLLDQISVLMNRTTMIICVLWEHRENWPAGKAESCSQYPKAIRSTPIYLQNYFKELDPNNLNLVISNSLLSLGFAFQSFTLGYFELLLFQTIYYFPTKFEIVGFIVCSVSFVTLYWSSPEELESSGLITTRVWLILFSTLTKWNDDSTSLKP